MVCGFSKEVFAMKKRLLAALLSAVLLLTLVPTAFAASDLDGHWAKKYIDYLADEDIINPSATTGKYQPDAKVTRAEFMRYINRAFHFTETASISYTDVPKNAWYYETVCIAQKYGYINGVGSGKMDPTGTVTREQAATIIGRLYKADLELVGRLHQSGGRQGLSCRIQRRNLSADTRGNARRSRENHLLLPWHLTFTGGQGLYGCRPPGRHDQCHHFGKLHAVRRDD